MNFAFLMDPLETVIFEKDTSLILMAAAKRRGHRIFYLANGGITFQENQFKFHVEEVNPQLIEEKPFVRLDAKVLTEKDVDAIFIRTDPPFDGQYLFNTWLLDQLPKKIFVINDPNGIRSANEKLWVLQFKNIIPATLVGRNKEEMFKFIAQEKDVVAKPTDGHGGKGVFRIKKFDTNANVILETLTQNWNKDIILQRYIPAAQAGDKRILLLNGEPLGAVLRVHKKGEHRNNFFSGGKPYPTKITVSDLKIIRMLKPKLKALGLYFVGIDIIGNYLVEVNVTSPTCLQEINRLYNCRLEDKIIKFVENEVKK